MTGRLAGKTALLTASAQGIGYETALAMAREGAEVYATDIDPKVATVFAGAKNIIPRRLDVLDAAAVRSLVDSLPPLDVLFNCAGYVHQGTILECSAKDWDFSFNLNVRSMYTTISCALPRMLERGRGSIVNMSSMASSIKGFPNRFAYCATKAAVIGLTKSVAADYVSRGVRCNAVAPGTVDTPSLHDRINASPDPAAALKNFIARQPMGRVGKPEEIAHVVVFLASDESAFVTGSVYSVDGGASI